MNISSNGPLRSPSGVNAVGASYTPSVAPTTSSSGGSSSQVSSAAKELASLAKLAHEASGVRQDKVDELKSQVDSGQYKVDIDKLADHLNKIL